MTWRASFNRLAPTLKDAYRDLSRDRELLQNFIVKNGVSVEEFKFSAVQNSKEYEDLYDQRGRRTVRFKGYNLSQTLEIESRNVDRIEELSRQVTDLLNQGIELSSSTPQYFYTKLPELKLKMIAEASRDGRARALKIAQVSGSSLAKLRFASLGVFQITAQNSNEDYRWGGTFNAAAKKKTATITMKLQFGVE